MKKLFLALLLILATVDAFGYVFEIGQFRYFVISEKDHQVEVSAVTHSSLSGDIEIPAEVTNNSITYSVTSVGSYGFSSCGITSVILPPTVEKIDYGAFINCNALTSVIFSESLREIGNLAFNECTSLASVVIPESVTTIGGGAFSECTGLSSAVISNTVEIIGRVAFSGCSSLTTINIPASVTEIGDLAFLQCDSMTEITVDEDNQHFSSIDGILYDKDRKEVIYCPTGKTGEIILPETVEKIGYATFCYCAGLTSVIMPSSVISIGESAFGGCTGLSSITIPSSVRSIGNYAFINCPLLTSINIPGSVTKIGKRVFAECTALEAITVDSDSWSFSSFDGVLLDKHCFKVICCPIGKKGDFTVPGRVRDIVSEAFLDCTSLDKVVMSSVVSIGQSAFSGCTGLSEIVLPNSLKEIDYAAFWGCSGLTSLTIPESLRTLTNGVFFDCTGLTSVFLPDGLEFMGHGTFGGCTGLTSIRIPSTLSVLGGNPFVGCINLTEISVDDENEYFCSVDGVMFNKDITKLSVFPAGRSGEYSIPETVTEIGEYGFSTSIYLSVLHIPGSLNKIDLWGFGGCTGLSEIYCAGEKPAWTYGNMSPFAYQTFEEAVLYVPEGFLDIYRSNSVWGCFSDIREFVPTGISDVEGDVNSEQPVMIYDMSGVNVGGDVESLRPGIYIIRQGETAKKIIVR
ncbi:MAG: leucine-rich repeat domain-containing protein [Muribaculaceae bacterium]|nr:leucine-rich repeat domain-containing protein [Muribaculaceae bacterium]